MIKMINAYLKFNSSVNKEQIEQLLVGQLEMEIELYFNKHNLGELTVYGDQMQLNNLYSFVKIMENDFDMAILLVLVPRFDERFALLVLDSHFKSGVYSAYDLLIKLNYSNNYDFPSLFANVDKELMDTVKAYIECGLNSSAAARILYVHRNTFNYRLKKFMEITNIDIRIVSNAFFVYLFIIK